MKNLLFLAILSLTSLYLQAQIVNIPDANFKNALVNTNCVDTDGNGVGDSDADLNNDGEIQLSEALLATSLHLNGQQIESLEGVQSFTNLGRLDCIDNELSSLDLTQNPQLEMLELTSNFITAIDLTQNPILKILVCRYNLLSTVDLSQNLLLENIFLSFNAINSLDVTPLSNLIELNVQGNELVNLDVSQNLFLESLNCRENQLAAIDVSQNLNLDWFVCRYNLITELDLTQNINLVSLDASNNELTSLNIKNGNNTDLVKMYAIGNFDLYCIEVDSLVYANNQICDPNPFQGWCKDTWAEYSELCELGVEDTYHTAFSMYPNPVQDILRIDNTSNVTITSIRVYDVLGRLVLAQNEEFNQIDVLHLDSGLLFVEIGTDSGVVTKKIIKE